MKKVLYATAVLLVASLSSQAIHFKDAGKSYSKSVKNLSKAAQYEKYADDYEKKAQKYKDAGNQRMAELMQNCAKAKRMIAEGYKNGDHAKLAKGNSDYAQARNVLKQEYCKLKSKKSLKEKNIACKSGKKDYKKSSGKKSTGERKAEKFLRKADYYSKKAAMHEKKGNTSLAKRYRHFAEQLSKKAMQEESGSE